MTDSEEIKQVIVVRKDLKMRRGKEAAQVAHASMKFLAEAVTDEGQGTGGPALTDMEWEWLQGPFAKIVLSADTEEELLELYDQAKSSSLVVKKIIDSGRTEFHGEPTLTCIAIGPYYADRIDQITGHLKLR